MGRIYQTCEFLNDYPNSFHYTKQFHPTPSHYSTSLTLTVSLIQPFSLSKPSHNSSIAHCSKPSHNSPSHCQSQTYLTPHETHFPGIIQIVFDQLKSYVTLCLPRVFHFVVLNKRNKRFWK
jgi:hypothetical protein